jgi:hypothetical protein
MKDPNSYKPSTTSTDPPSYIYRKVNNNNRRLKNISRKEYFILLLLPTLLSILSVLSIGFYIKKDLSTNIHSLNFQQQQLTQCIVQLQNQNTKPQPTPTTNPIPKDFNIKITELENFKKDLQNKIQDLQKEIAESKVTQSQINSTGDETLVYKERNRLIQYADQAIAKGSRNHLELIIEQIQKSPYPEVRDAAIVEFKKVQNFFSLHNYIDNSYYIKIRDHFPDSPAIQDADLTLTDLLSIAKNHQQDWKFRLRATFLISNLNDESILPILFDILQTDPSLDVVEQAQLCIQKKLGQSAPLFEFKIIDSWKAKTSTTP